MSCVLSILGHSLDIDKFILKSKLEPDEKVYKGEPAFKSKPNGRKMLYSYLTIVTSKASFYELDKQIDDTIRFLKKHKKKLEYISKIKEVEYATLDFGIFSKELLNQSSVQHSYLPNSLIKLVSEFGIGIEISIYKQTTKTSPLKRIG